MKTYNIALLCRPSKDVPGQWIAHCLDIDLVTQGKSASDAVKMAQEAVVMLVQHELEQGRDPLDRRAPDEDWKVFQRVLEKGTPVASLAELPHTAVLAGFLMVRIEHQRPAPARKKKVPGLFVGTNAACAAPA